MHVKVVAGAMACVLLAAGCTATATQNTVSNGKDIKNIVANLSTKLGKLDSLAALPSDSPASGYESGGGGLSGEPWPIWGVPGARGPKDQGIAASKYPVLGTVSLRPVLTALPGKSSYEFAVMDVAGKNTLWDSGTVTSSNADCVINNSKAACTLPQNKVGVLTNGSTYRLVTTADGVTSSRLFQVSVAAGTTGATGAGIMGKRYQASVANMQVGLSFSTANQGPVPGSQVTNNNHWGLPAGWNWEGPAGGFITITRASAATQYAGFAELMTVDTGNGSQTLGCKPTSTGASTSVCGALTGNLAGLGFSATIAADNTVILTSQASSQNWTFNSSDQLIASGSTGAAPIDFTYRTIDGSSTPVLDSMSVPAVDWTWKFFYSGDSQCDDQNLPDGFVSTPTGYTCGWNEPGGDHSAILYTQPDSAKVPRISRVINTPPECKSWQDCDQSELAVFDLGWNSKNQIDWQRQDALVDAAVLGAIDPADNAYWSQTSYDDLGRVISVRQPLEKADTGGGNGAVGGSLETYQYQPADARWAPATRQIVRTDSLTGVPTTSSLIAFDDAGRVIYQQDPDGVVNSTVWDADLPLQYATIQNKGVSATTYDSFNRPTASYTGNIAAFNTTTCAANAPNRSNKSCLPNNSANQVLASSTATYDSSAATGNGLRARWFNTSDFSGNPVSVTNESQKGSTGFSVQAPSGASDHWGVALDGGVVLDQAGTWNLTVDVPQNMFSAGTLFVDGSICTTIASTETEASCTFTSDGSTYPIQLELSHAGGNISAGNVTITLQQDQFSPPITGNGHFLTKWGTTAVSVSTDHNPDGSAIVQKQTPVYGDPITDLPTSVATQPVNTNKVAASLKSRTVSIKRGVHQPDKMVSTAEYAPNDFGGAITTSTSGPSGSKRTAKYWGLNDTPRSVNLPNADQLPQDIQNTPQHGLLQMQTSPSGRQNWVVSDKYGSGVCEASVQAGNDPVWSCQQRDGRDRLVSAIARGQDGQPDINLSYSYRFDNSAGSSPFVVTSTRSEADKTTTEVTREWASGLTDSYTGDDGSTTTLTYTPSGAAASSTTVVPNSAAADLLPMIGVARASDPPNGDTTIAYRYTYDSIGRPLTLSDQDEELAKVNYDPSNPRRIDSYDYLNNKIHLALHYDKFGRALSQTWKLPEGTIDASATTTALGRAISDQFDNMSDTYTYDPFGRLLQADTKVGQTTHSFSYAFDIDSQRTCAAADIPNPKHADCSTLPGATTFTYQNNQLIASSAASSKIPADPLNKDGSYKQIGMQTYEYDAARQLVSATDTSAMESPAAATPSASTSPFGLGDQAANSIADSVATPTASASASASSQSAAPGTPSTDPVMPEQKAGSATESAGSATPAQSSSASPSPSPSAAQPSRAEEVRYLRDSSNRPMAQATRTADGTSGFSYVYSQGGTGVSPLATVDQSGTVTPIITLPGGLTLQGNTPMISSPGGNALVKLGTDGKRLDQPDGLWGPYGEQVAAASSNPNMPNPGWRGQTSQLDGTLMVLGARGYRSDVATFLQPDPIPGGSATSNDYAYVAGDPVNTADLTGTMSEVWAALIGNLTAMALEFVILEGVYKIIDLLPEAIWTTLGGSLSKVVTFVANAGVNLVMSVGVELAIDGHTPDGMSNAAVIVAGVSAGLSGYFGSSYAGCRARGVSIKNALTETFSPKAIFKRFVKSVFGLDKAETIVQDMNEAAVLVKAGDFDGAGTKLFGAENMTKMKEALASVENKLTELKDQVEDFAERKVESAKATTQNTVNSATTSVTVVGGSTFVGACLGGPVGALVGAGTGLVLKKVMSTSWGEGLLYWAGVVTG